MTINEYVKTVAREIINKPSSYESILVKATNVIEKSNIRVESKDKFWIDLYNELGGDLTHSFESQDSGSLWDLIAAAKFAIAAKVQEKK